MRRAEAYFDIRAHVMGAAASAPPSQPDEPATQPVTTLADAEWKSPCRKALYGMVMDGLEQLIATAPPGHKQEMGSVYTRLLDWYVWDGN